MRAVLSAAALLLLAPPPAISAQIMRVTSRGEGPVIGVETTSGSVRDSLGVLIIGVTTNGPADQAGIEEGDRIASANGVDLRLSAADAGDREMRGLMSRRLARAVAKLKAGEAVALHVYHNGAYHDVKVTTVKASDLAIEDDGNATFRVYSPAESQELRRSFEEMHIGAPDMRELEGGRDDAMRGVRIQLRDMRPLIRSMPGVIDLGVHRI
jgi:PDZ domain